MNPIAFVADNNLAHERHDAERDRCVAALAPTSGRWLEQYAQLADAAWESGWDAAIIAYERHDSDYAPSLNDADVIAAVRSAADEAAANSTRIGAPGSDIREKYATQAAMLYAAAARLEALLKVEVQ